MSTGLCNNRVGLAEKNEFFCARVGSKREAQSHFFLIRACVLGNLRTYRRTAFEEPGFLFVEIFEMASGPASVGWAE